MNNADAYAAIAFILAVLVLTRWRDIRRFVASAIRVLDLWHCRIALRQMHPAHPDAGYVHQRILQLQTERSFNLQRKP